MDMLDTQQQTLTPEQVADGDAPAKHPHDWLDNNGKNDWGKWTTHIQGKEKTVWEATLNIANAADGRKILYDIGPIKK